MSELRVALIIPSGNGSLSFRLLARLLQSLEKTDFPRDYQLFLRVSDNKDNKSEMLKHVVALGVFDYALVMHNDHYFTGPFWQAMLAAKAEIVCGVPDGPIHKPVDQELLCLKIAYVKEHPVERVIEYTDPPFQLVQVKVPVAHDRILDQGRESNEL